MPRIQRLEVQDFRGIKQEVRLLFESKSILLLGENGTGKSSFVDALEKLFTGRVTTLDGRGQGLSSDRQGPHIGSGDNPPRIAVTFDNPESTRISLGFDVERLPSDVREYAHSAHENLYILRRLQLLVFIDCQPRDRYAMLRAFLPLSGVEEIEDALQAALERAEQQLQEAKQGSATFVAELKRLLERQDLGETLSEQDVIGAINRTLEDIGQPPVDSLQAIDGALHQIDTSLRAFGDRTRQTGISNVERAIQQFKEVVSSLSATLNSMASTVQGLRNLEAKEARVFYETVLEQGVRWIQEENRNTCPLCEQEIDSDKLLARVRERLEAMRQILELRRRALQELEQVRHQLRSAREALARASREIALISEEDRGKCQEALQKIGVATAKATEALAADLRELAVETIGKANDAFRADSSTWRRVLAEQSRLRKLLESLPSPEGAQRLLSTREKLRRAKELWPRISTLSGEVTKLEQRSSLAGKLAEAARDARKEEVQNIFDDVSDDIDRIYSELHHDENLGGIRLEVREVGQGSATLRGDYYDRQNQDPRGYYSDAHLDTLGLSIFLALRRWYRKQQPEFDLLVLDDVLTSVDTAHSVTLSQIILREFQDYQLLLTTHDRIWFEHMRDIQARCRVANTFINKIIHRWSIDEGPDIREPLDERRKINAVILSGTPQEIAGAAGRLFEHILQEMRYTLRLSVEAKRGEQYEIGDLWPAFYKEVRTTYPTFYEQSKQTLESLDVRWPIRNWIGAHFNEWAQNVSHNTAEGFAAAVSSLFDSVFCDSCRRFIEPSTTPLGQLACRRGEKMYPATHKKAIPPRPREELVRETQGILSGAHLDTELYLTLKREEAEQEH